MTDERTGARDIEIPAIPPGSLLAFRFALGARLAVRDGFELYGAFGDVGFGDVLVRLIRPSHAGSEGGSLAMRLAEQAEDLREVVHPGIARLVADGWDERLGARFLVFEAVAGELLEARLAHVRKLDVGAALVLADALCEAVGVLHDRGLVCLDLSPARVAVAPAGAPFPIKLAEPGPHRRGETPPPPAGADEALPYLAPERLRGAASDERADVHGIGALLYHVLGGRAPFRGATIDEVLEARRKGVPPMFAAGVSPADEADRAARRCLADDPAQRFSGVAELRALLAELRAKLPAR